MYVITEPKSKKEFIKVFKFFYMKWHFFKFPFVNFEFFKGEKKEPLTKMISQTGYYWSAETCCLFVDDYKVKMHENSSNFKKKIFVFSMNSPTNF